MGLISKVVVLTLLVSVVTGCSRIPFLGGNRSANQAGDAPEATQNQPGTRTQVQRANQPTQQAQNTNPGSAPSSNDALNSDNPNTDGSSDSNSGVSALW